MAWMKGEQMPSFSLQHTLQECSVAAKKGKKKNFSAICFVSLDKLLSSMTPFSTIYRVWNILLSIKTKLVCPWGFIFVLLITFS